MRAPGASIRAAFSWRATFLSDASVGSLPSPTFLSSKAEVHSKNVRISPERVSQKIAMRRSSPSSSGADTWSNG